tara:strand:- start:1571 stop:1897 length:327 start_codon:yes stop_codon:yes gene_type:complete
MKITKNTLKQLIKEEMAAIDEISQKTGAAPGEDFGASIYGQFGKRAAGNPGQWVEMADRLRQMSRVWVDVEDAKMLSVVADILYTAEDEYMARMNKAMGRKHTTRVRD